MSNCSDQNVCAHAHIACRHQLVSAPHSFHKISKKRNEDVSHLLNLYGETTMYVTAQLISFKFLRELHNFATVAKLMLLLL